MGGSGQDAQRKAWNEAMRSAAGAAALPVSLQGSTSARRSGRRKKQARRERARKVTNLGVDSEGYRSAVWLDALENVDPASAAADDDEEYDELEELESKRKKRRGAAAKSAGVLPPRFRPRSFASILLEEASRSDGVARAFLDAEARLPPSQQLPRRKFCPVTGLEGIYTEPKSGISFASLNALDQIRERSPPWMTLGGSAAYFEAAKSLRDE